MTLEERLAFSQNHPWGNRWPEEMVRHFLTQLTSHRSNILEHKDALAVVIDKVTNPGNHVALEILGLRAGREEALSEIVERAKVLVPQTRAGFELGLPADFEPPAAWGLEKCYETFGMLNEAPGNAEPPPPGLCTIVTDRDEEELYAVLKTTFATNPDTHIPDFESWQAMRRLPSRSKTWGIWQNKQLVAFLNLNVPREIALAEVRTLGVLAEHRGKGYARALIQRALAFVSQLEIPRCALTVAVENESALSLYRSLGFQPVEHHRVYRWRRP